jgi:two-component sensor histidine kinase
MREIQTSMADTDLKAAWERLHQATFRIAAEHDLAPLLRQIAVEARDLSGARFALLALPDEDGRLAETIAAEIDAAEQARLEALLHEIGWFEALLQQPDIQYARVQPLLVTLLGLPLCVGEQIVAALILGDATDTDVVLYGLAGYAAVAILNAQLAQRVQDLEDELAHRTAAQDAMAHEMSHRVRNSLQMAVGFLSYALTRRSSGASGSLEDAVRAAIDRIKGLGAIQEVLATTDAQVGFQELTRQAVAVTVPEALSGAKPLLVFEGPDVALPAEQAKSLALAVNELVINALRYGLDKSERSGVYVITSRDADGVRITVRDEGQGLPDEFDMRRDRGLGLTVARGLIERGLGGSLSLSRSDGGTSAVIRLPQAEG